MIHKLKNFYSEARFFFRCIHRFLLHKIYILNSFPKKNANHNVVVFDVEDNSYTRHLNNLILFFVRSEYLVYIKLNPVFLGDLQQYSLNLLKTDNVYFVFKLPKYRKIAFSSYEKEGYIRLSFDYFTSSKVPNTSISYPFSMHPMILKDLDDKQLIKLRKSTKKFRLLFAGAINEEYRSENFEKIFNLIDRNTIIRDIKSKYSANNLELVKTQDCFKKLNKNLYLNKIVLIESGIDHIVYFDKWLKLLSKADFFLALPGVKIPLCHNLVEAMSLGVIPVIQYQSYLPVKLQNNINCITYNSENELFMKISDLMHMDTSAIDNLRDGVIEYYEKYLKPQEFIRNVEEKVDKGMLECLYLYSEDKTVDAYKTELGLY